MLAAGSTDIFSFFTQVYNNTGVLILGASSRLNVNCKDVTEGYLQICNNRDSKVQ